MHKTSRPFYTKTHKRSREPKAPATPTDSLDLSNYCPSDLILKRIYLRRTATTVMSAAYIVMYNNAIV